MQPFFHRWPDADRERMDTIVRWSGAEKEVTEQELRQSQKYGHGNATYMYTHTHNNKKVNKVVFIFINFLVAVKTKKK